MDGIFGSQSASRDTIRIVVVLAVSSITRLQQLLLFVPGLLSVPPLLESYIHIIFTYSITELIISEIEMSHEILKRSD